MAEIPVDICRLAHGADLPLPDYATSGSAGLDLRAAVEAAQPVRLLPMARAIIPTGISIALPQDYEAQIRPRSGLAAKHGLTVLNAPGTIDADYRGELGVIMVNLGEDAVTIERGMRIAQLVIAPVSRISWKEISSLSETPRGMEGFGSTGVGGAAGGER